MDRRGVSGNGWTRSCGLALALGVKGHLAPPAGAQHLAATARKVARPRSCGDRTEARYHGLTAGPAAGGGGPDPADRATSSTTEPLTGYWATEAEYPELRALRTFSAAWYRRWRDLHLAKYPDVEQSTRDNLEMFIAMAERREHSSGPGRTPRATTSTP